MHTLNKSARTNHQHGFSLIEVLIAMVILAIGLLGMAQMQASGMRSTHGAYLRSQATFLVADMLDSMRANITVARGGGYTTGLGNPTPNPVPGGGLALADVTTWKTNLRTLLPLGDGTITNAGSDVTVTVQWSSIRQNEAGGAAQAKTFIVDTTL